MKTIKIFFVCLMMAFVVSSCAPLTCDEANEQLRDAIDTWVSNPTESNCQAARSALNELKNNSECTQSAKDLAQAILNNTDC